MKGDSMSEDLTKKLSKGDNTEIFLILQHIDSRLQNLEQKVEERLYDTRPIWEKVVADVAQLQAGQQQLQEGQQRLEAEMKEIKFSVRDLDRRMSVMSDTMIAIRANYKDMDTRVYELELHQRNQSKPQT
jgi:septal ring factor EnvC (AmiA/AmiB activator)